MKNTFPPIISNTLTSFLSGKALGENYSLAAALIGSYVMDDG